MTRASRIRIAACLAAAALATGPLAGSGAEEAERSAPSGIEEGSQTRAPEEAAASAPAPGPPAAPIRIYVPPGRGMSKARVGGATRSSRGLPPLRALAPDEVGLTTSAQPILYWFAPTGIETRVDFTLIDETSVAPLLETTLPGPFPAGIHAVALAQHGVRLEEGRLYQWYVAAIDDPERRSGDRIAGAAILREPATPELERSLAEAGAAERHRVLAGSGLWYDAFEALSRGVAADPADGALHEDRGRLLDEVGLPDAAAFARSLAGSP
jgi:hypothetical protein